MEWGGWIWRGVMGEPSVCDVCNGESGGKQVGVACIPGVPMSIMWCSECLKHNCAPKWILEFDYSMSDGDLRNLQEWASERETWLDGKYITLRELVAITPADELQRWIASTNPTDTEMEQGYVNDPSE
jgi:hypothetical protein